MYAPPHPVKKCVVLCVRELLCFVDPSLGPTSPDIPFWNIIQRPGVPKPFTMLFYKFHDGLWSFITKLKLFPLLRYILLAVVVKSLFFIFSREGYHDFKNYSLCYKMCDTLFRKLASRRVCVENQILFADIRPLSMKHNPNAICYLPYPFVEEFRYPNGNRNIPNIAIDIIPFIYPLHRFASVHDYMVHAIRPSQRHYVAKECLHNSHSKNLHP